MSLFYDFQQLALTTFYVNYLFSGIYTFGVTHILKFDFTLVNHRFKCF